MPQPLQCDSQPVTSIALQITTAVTHRTAGGPAATTRAAVPSGRLWVLRLPLQRARGPAATTRAAGPSAVSGHCIAFANPNGSNAQNRRGPSGDHARRSPFWRLWVLRLPLQRARGPAATTRAAGPSAVSGHCIALHNP